MKQVECCLFHSYDYNCSDKHGSETSAQQYSISVLSSRTGQPSSVYVASARREDVQERTHHDKHYVPQYVPTSSQGSDIFPASQDMKQKMMTLPTLTLQEDTARSTQVQQEQRTRYNPTWPKSQNAAIKDMTAITQQNSHGPTHKDVTPEHRRQVKPTVSVTTQDVLGCLNSSHSFLALEAAEVWLSLTYTGNRSGSPRLHAPSTCWLQVTGQGHGVMSILVLNATCFTDNRLVVHSQSWNGQSYDCDPTAWVAPGVELSMPSAVANVSIEINDASTPFGLQVQFKVVPQRHWGDGLERRDVTRYLGILSKGASRIGNS